MKNLYYLLVLTPTLLTELKRLENNSIQITKNFLNIDFDLAELSIEKRKTNQHLTFWSTIKLGDMEVETQISELEYLKCLKHEVNTKLHTIQKTRYHFEYMEQKFVIDTYHFSEMYGILTVTINDEIDLTNENLKIDFPHYVSLVQQLKNFNEKKLSDCLTF